MTNKAIYSIQDKRNSMLIKHVWDGDTNLFLSWTPSTEDAARWCGDCKQQAYDGLPPNLRQHCMIVDNNPPYDGWVYLCRTCGQEVEVIS